MERASKPGSTESRESMMSLKVGEDLKPVSTIERLSVHDWSPGPVHTEFEMKMIEDVSQKEYPGADPDTIHYFKNVYLPSSVDVFQTLGQSPDDIAKCTKKVIEASSPRFRNLTNPLYTPIVALKMADETGGLSVRAFYHMLFNLGGLMHISMTALKYLTCGCLRSRTISPN
ncbi:hypothetical protein MHYP_G00106140 [Metynnis hypsauchen]